MFEDSVNELKMTLWLALWSWAMTDIATWSWWELPRRRISPRY